MRTVTYMFENGLVDYVTHLNRGKPAIHRTIIGFEADSTDGDGQAMSLEMAMQWNAQFSESVHTFANTINTHEGGTHEEGFRAALTTLVNKFAREWNILKEKDANLSGDDVREGLTAIVSLKMAEPQFEGQTKTKLGNTEAKSFVQKLVNEQLGMWFEQNPTEGKEIARKAQSASIARLAARKARDAARSRKGLMGGGGLPGKLADCQSTEPAECELFIVEGDSAGGPAKAGPRRAGPGDLADPRQDLERREGAHRPDPPEPGGAGDHLRARHRASTRTSTSSGCATTRSCSWPTPTSTASTSARCCSRCCSASCAR